MVIVSFWIVIADIWKIMADKGGKAGGAATNYNDMKGKLKEFLSGFHKVNDRGQKEFVYARQLTSIAHREQVSSFHPFNNLFF